MHYILIVLIIWLLSVVQSVYFNVFFPALHLLTEIFFIDLSLLALITFCFFLNEKKVVGVAIISGLIIDVVFSSWIGLHTFVYGFIAYWSILIFRNMLERNFLVYMAAVIINFLMYYLLVFIINVMFGFITYNSTIFFDKNFFGGLLLTALLAAIIFNPLKKYYASRGVTLDAS